MLTGGFPCQPFSLAGKRKGKEDDRYLWPEMLRAIDEIRPRWVCGENVAGIVSMVQPEVGRATVESTADFFGEEDSQVITEYQEYVIETVCKDLERIGYSVQPVIIPACAVGAPHRRDRIWFVAHTIDSYASGASGRHEGEGGTERIQERDEMEQSSKSGVLRDAANAKSRRCGFRSSTHIWEASGEKHPSCNKVEIRLQQFCEPSGVWDAADTSRARRKECDIPEIAEGTGHGAGRDYEKDGPWTNFPTQPPVRGRNDGVPAGLVGITVSKHRNESIKAYGNAIVHQVAIQIFKSIQEYETPNLVPGARR